MEDDDDIQSRRSPTANGRIAVTVAAPTPPLPSNSLTLALPIQNHHRTHSSGGVREDCWSEGATAVLIDAWGERYLELSRGNLKQKHWKEVADIVSSLEDYTKLPKTDVQCKNRIDTVKKKYKVEKARIASRGGPSKWRFFDKLDELIGPNAKTNSMPTSVDANNNNNNNNNYKYQQKVPMGIPVGVRSSCAAPQDRFQNNKPCRKRPPVDSDDDDDNENLVDSSEDLPPEANKRGMSQRKPRMSNNANPVKKRMMMNKKSGGGSKESNRRSSSSIRELTRVIWKFGDAYEQAETAKLQQLVEMEKQRMKFAKDLELQRMQYFMKTQLELSQLKNRRTGGGTNNNNHHNGISTNQNDDDDNDNDDDNNSASST
ncbi:hypothetical protein OROGR_028793 [Orobanche gracilis]